MSSICQSFKMARWDDSIKIGKSESKEILVNAVPVQGNLWIFYEMHEQKGIRVLDTATREVSIVDCQFPAEFGERTNSITSHGDQIFMFRKAEESRYLLFKFCTVTLKFDIFQGIKATYIINNCPILGNKMYFLHYDNDSSQTLASIDLQTKAFVDEWNLTGTVLGAQLLAYAGNLYMMEKKGINRWVSRLNLLTGRIEQLNQGDYMCGALNLGMISRFTNRNIFLDSSLDLDHVFLQTFDFSTNSWAYREVENIFKDSSVQATFEIGSEIFVLLKNFDTHVFSINVLDLASCPPAKPLCVVRAEYFKPAKRFCKGVKKSEDLEKDHGQTELEPMDETSAEIPKKIGRTKTSGLRRCTA